MRPANTLLTKIKKLEEDDIVILKKRIDIATVIILVFLAVLIARLWFLQVRNGPDYEQLANNNRVRMRDIVAPRGNVLDQKGRVLVTNRPSFNIVWTKEDAPDPEKVIKQLAKILDTDISVLLDRIRKAADNPRHIPIRLKEDIDWNVLAYIENNRYELPGISIEVLPFRNYFFDGLASLNIGYLGEINKQELEERQDENYQVGDQLGKTGLEKLYEEELRGEKGRLYVEVDAHGFEQRRLRGLEPLPGNDLQLTIDLELQKISETAMEGKAGAVVALEVGTGKVLALASTPSLKLEEFLGGISLNAWNELLNDPLHPLVNKAIMGLYPPGSTYKMIPAIAGITEREITPETVFYCSGSLKFGNRTYGCWKRGGHGAVDLHRALAESCDVYFYMVGQKLGVDTLARYAESFGLGHLTGIELENEKSGLIPTSDWKRTRYKEAWQKGETLSIVIGQGFNLTTPLQICKMTAAIANGGTLYRPQLIQAIYDPEGEILHSFSPAVAGEALGSERTFKLVQKALVAAVNSKHGTGSAAKMEDITVAGKTGTAQVIRLSQYKGVDEDQIPYKYRDHAWFTCYAPAEKPEIAVTVLVEHGSHGGSAAGPIAKTVLEAYFQNKLKTADTDPEKK
jgi:penicillin-binding protein 2